MSIIIIIISSSSSRGRSGSIVMGNVRMRARRRRLASQDRIGLKAIRRPAGPRAPLLDKHSAKTCLFIQRRSMLDINPTGSRYFPFLAQALSVH
jgi:hypothetical protein